MLFTSVLYIIFMSVAQWIGNERDCNISWLLNASYFVVYQKYISHAGRSASQGSTLPHYSHHPRPATRGANAYRFRVGGVGVRIIAGTDFLQSQDLGYRFFIINIPEDGALKVQRRLEV